MPSGSQVRGASKSVVEIDGCLHYLFVTELASDNEELQVEGEALDRQQRHDLFEHLTAEKLEARLRITDLDPEECPDEQLIHDTLKAACRRVLDIRHGMPLGANNSVTIEGLHHRD